MILRFLTSSIYAIQHIFLKIAIYCPDFFLTYLQLNIFFANIFLVSTSAKYIYVLAV